MTFLKYILIPSLQLLLWTGFLNLMLSKTLSKSAVGYNLAVPTISAPIQKYLFAKVVPLFCFYDPVDYSCSAFFSDVQNTTADLFIGASRARCPSS